MDTPTRDLIEACRLAKEPTGVETRTYLAFLTDQEQSMAYDHVMRETGLSDAQMKFCFWLEDDMKRIEKSLFGGKKTANKTWTIVETQNSYGDKINFAGNDPYDDGVVNDDDRRNPEEYMWHLVRHAGYRAQTWQEMEKTKAADAERLAHASTKDAIRMRARRKAGKVKPRPPRPARTLAQKVEDRRKMVATREANIAAASNSVTLSMTIGQQVGQKIKAEKSLRSAKKALATAERLLAESLVVPK